MRTSGYLLLSDPEPLLEYQRRLPPLSEPPVLALARAIAASPGWPDGCELIVHPGSPPKLFVFGRFDAEGEAWLRCQSRALPRACARLRYVGYAQIERDCEQLAARLREHLGPDLHRADFTAIPRGGFVVLGLLASLLPRQAPAGAEEGLLVVVDDCALSGIRFGQTLRRYDSSRIVFAPLYSPPELRAVIREREPRVEAVLSAADVAGERVEAGPEDGYWSGDTEALAFPWNEPDRSVWNPNAQRWETAWRIVPPELCLKNRPRPGFEPIPVQVHPAP